MKNELADLIFLSIREARSIEELAERLVDRGVQIVPEGAMILTRAELDALNNYEKCRMQNAECRAASDVAREIFAEIYEDCFDQFGYINYEALAELKKKYTEEGK